MTPDPTTRGRDAGRQARPALLSTLLLPRDMLVRRMARRPGDGGGRSAERRIGLLLLVVGGVAGVLMALLTGP